MEDMALTKERAYDLLRQEGFTSIYDWFDSPDTDYAEHTHAGLTAHIILEGKMELTIEGKTTAYGPGQRVDVPAGVLHAARMGPEGCLYVIGEK